MVSTNPHLWLRAETKPNEHRSALTPSDTKKLLNEGFRITVEKSDQRIFADKDFVEYSIYNFIPTVGLINTSAGCELVESNTWPQAPKDAYIVGLKELPEWDTISPLPHKHVFFGHCYKGQAGWKELLRRFVDGGGTLLDMEFLNDEKGRRVAAFGYHAGFAGAAIGLDVWSHQQIGGETQKYPAVKPYPNENELIAHIKNRLEQSAAKIGRSPKVLVMGALGRCGTGACDLLVKCGIPSDHILKWDMQETAKGGPFYDLLGVDIFVNCIYLSKPIPPFLTMEMLGKNDRRLSVVVDVSCDTTNPHNPIPIYNRNTTFLDPVLTVKTDSNVPLAMIAIDHLPTLLPKESSEFFCANLLPSIMELKTYPQARVWADVLSLFNKKVTEMQQQS